MKINFHHYERPDNFVFTILPTVCFGREENPAYIDYYVIIPWLVFNIEIIWTKNKR